MQVEDNTEAVRIILAFGVANASIGNAGKHRKHIPGASAHDAIFSLHRAGRIVIGAHRIIIFTVKVIAPLKHVTSHVVQTIAIGLETIHGSSIGKDTIIIIGMISYWWTYIIVVLTFARTEIVS